MMETLVTINLKESFAKDMNDIFKKYKMGSLDKMVLSIIDFNKIGKEFEEICEKEETPEEAQECLDLISKVHNAITAIVIRFSRSFEENGVQHINSAIFEEISFKTIEESTSATQH